MERFIFQDITKFVDYVPTALGSDLNELKPFLEEAEISLRTELIGAPLYYRIAQIAGGEPQAMIFDGVFDYTFDESIPPADILKAAQRVVCLKAYLSAIPFVDLIQTPNGFAVVNNSNQAPASRERVERLLESVSLRLTQALDFLILFAASYSVFRQLWQKETGLFNRHTEIVYWTTDELQKYSNQKRLRYSDLRSAHPLVLDLQSQTAQTVSNDYLNELIDKRRNAALNLQDRRVLERVKQIVGLKLQKIDSYPLTEQLANYLAARPSDFSTYFASQEYRLKIKRPYENKKSDPTFFFNG